MAVGEGGRGIGVSKGRGSGRGVRGEEAQYTTGDGQQWYNTLNLFR